MKVTLPLIKAFIIFPVNVMGVIPGILIWCSKEGAVFEEYQPSIDILRSFPGGLLVGAGASLCWISVSLFTEYGGGGTPAPYDPPKNFVVRGVYIRLRNPMMIGVILVLMGEALLLGSLPIFIWALIFLQACLVLIPFWEEPDLERRFGDAYLEYKRKVPRWVPKFKSSPVGNKMGEKKEKITMIDWIGNIIGFVVIGFIVFILIWPLIDPTPNRSSSLKENIHKATGN